MSAPAHGNERTGRRVGTADEIVLAHLSDGRHATVTDIATALHLPRTTVSHALERLAGRGVVQGQAPHESTRGRPSRRWSIAGSPGLIVAVVGAAHGLTAGVVRQDSEVLANVESGEPRGGPAEFNEVLRLVNHALTEADADAEEVAVGVIGLPGPSDFPSPHDDQLRPGAHLRRFRLWDGRPPAALLGDHLDRPVVCENDANLAALGEFHYGAGVGLDSLLFVSLARGTGAGLILDRHLHRGRAGLAGEIGHMHVDDDGRLCECGARGCFWHSMSIPTLLSELAHAHRRSFTINDLAAAAARMDADICRALHEFGHALGRRLADAVVVLDPDSIVVDGALENAATVIADGVREAINRYAPPAMANGVTVKPGELGTQAHLKGAAALVRTEGVHSQRRS